MAEPVESMPLTFNGKRAKYPWDEWLDGRVWKLVESDWYGQPIGSFRSTVYNAARARNKKVTFRSDGNGCAYIQARTRTGN